MNKVYFIAFIFLISITSIFSEETKSSLENDLDSDVNSDYFDKLKFVEELNSISFTPFIRKHQYVLVYFYITGCQKCSEFAPHFNAAAESIKTNSKDSSIVGFGKVNCKEESALAQQFEIGRYPTLLLFKEKDPEKFVIYRGEEKRVKIERMMRRLLDSISLDFKSESQIEELREYFDSMIIYVGDSKSQEYRRYSEVASKDSYDGLYFAHCSFSTCSKYLDAEEGDVVILKAFDEKKNILKKGYSDGEFKHFIEQKYYIDVHEFNEVTYFMTFDRQNVSLYLFRDKEQDKDNKYFNMLKNIAPEVKTKIQLVILDIKNPVEKILANYFHITDSHLPVAYIFEPGKVRVLRYKLNDISEDSLKTFISNYSSKLLDPVLKSELPKENPIDENSVKYITADEFNDFVNDTSKDVVIMFYTEECVHCQDHYPTYFTLAKQLSKSNPNIVFGKFNYTKNETKKIYTDRYPGIFIWSSDDKAEVAFTEEINSQNLLNFLISNASYPLHIHDDL